MTPLPAHPTCDHILPMSTVRGNRQRFSADLAETCFVLGTFGRPGRAPPSAAAERPTRTRPRAHWRARAAEVCLDFRRRNLRRFPEMTSPDSPGAQVGPVNQNVPPCGE